MEAPAGDAPVGDAPVGDAPVGEAPAGDAPVGDASFAGDLDADRPAPAAAAPAPPRRRRRRDTAAPPPPLVLIDIEPSGSGGFINGRFDLQIRGRAASPAAIEEVELEVGGAVVARAVFVQPHRASPTVLRDGTPARQRAFQFTLPRRHGEAAAPCACIIRARTAEGHVHAENFEITVDPTGPEQVVVASGPTATGVSYAGVRPPIVLYVERAVVDSEGYLTVHGWAVAQSSIVTIQVFAGNEERLPAAQVGAQRDDVATFYPSYPNARVSGFTMTAPLGGSAISLEAVRVEAISLNGFASETLVPVERIAGRPAVRPAAPRPAAPAAAPFPETPIAPAFAPLRQEPVYRLKADFHVALDAPPLAPPPPPPAAAAPEPPAAPVPEPEPPAEEPHDPRRDIHFFCDRAAISPEGTLSVLGWAVCAAGVASVAVQLDGVRVGEAELGTLRTDVGDRFSEIPDARLAGFRLSRRIVNLAEGEHSVRVTVTNTAGDTAEESKLVVAAIPIAPSPAPAPPPTPAPDRSEFRFELDSPQVVDGVVHEPITGRLTIEGWVLARSTVVGIDVYLNDQRLGEAHYGLARQDVGVAFPDWDNSLRSGYAFHCPPRSLRDGIHEVRLIVRAKNGQEFIHRFGIEVRKAEDDDEVTTIRRKISRVEANVLADVLDGMGHHPAFHVLLRPAAEFVPEQARGTLNSLASQVYPNWRLTALAGSVEDAATLRKLAAAVGLADRTVVVGPDDPVFDQPLGSGDAADFHGVLCPGDEISADALAEMALASARYRSAELLYADEARISPASKEKEAFFKPDFSRDLLLSTNYIGRPWFAADALLSRLAVTPRALLAGGEYDLLLRCAEAAASVRHISKLLAQRGPEPLDSDEAEQAALERAAARRNEAAQVLPGCVPGTWRLKRTAPAKGKVAIIIPTCAAHGHIENCIRTLRAQTAYRNYEIVCIDNIPAKQVAWKVWLQQNADTVVEIAEAFNWSRFNNVAAAATDSEYLLFLNDDIEIEQRDWLDGLLEHAQRPEVGIVGPQLLYPSRKVQHAGMFLGAGIGRHAFRFAPFDDPGYFGLALTQRNVMAVTGACMLMRREFFDGLGGFDEAHSVINNDLDFCLRAYRAGKQTVYTPHVSLIHHELASRESMPDVFDTGHFESRWKTLFAAGDPYFSPRLSRYSDDYRPDDEPLQTVFSGHPLFRPADIQRILVVKLDHIGDFVTGLLPIRRLKSMFPHASITVLAGRHVRAFADMEPAIDELIEFEFFHARSQLGERELTQDDYLALQATLAPYRFDLAIDLRKHLSTRDVLKYTGARFLAGFDYMGQFPFLDIALEWEGDKTLQRKRNHIVDDLLALVEAIGTACETDRSLLPVEYPKPEPETLPETVRHLFDKPVVAVHPGAGNITKQWPVAYFSALVDLLTEQDGVNVLLIGGPDEVELADQLLGSLLRRDPVGSVAGLTPLSDLPRLLSACALYIGNDSGPKHIAAAMGVPTIGIHSGVVDAMEWGPVGRRAVALRRSMTCSPCYLAKAEDCPRALACLRYLDPALVHQTAQTLLGRPANEAVTPIETPVVAETVQEPALVEAVEVDTAAMDAAADSAIEPVAAIEAAAPETIEAAQSTESYDAPDSAEMEQAAQPSAAVDDLPPAAVAETADASALAEEAVSPPAAIPAEAQPTLPEANPPQQVARAQGEPSGHGASEQAISSAPRALPEDRAAVPQHHGKARTRGKRRSVAA
ncbi:MAG TPA: glycosyltransferase family 9 protein [Acetobacteraceae bacterium]